MTINTVKTQFIIFRTAAKKLPDNYHVTLDGGQVMPSSTVKLLGVTLDEHLTFKAHIEGVVLKCHGLIGALARSAPHLPTTLLKMAYSALVRSQLEYCSATFASAA